MDRRMISLAFLFLVLGVCQVRPNVVENVEMASRPRARRYPKICAGTDYGNSVRFEEGQEDMHYESLKSRYTNCTYVEGNLEISWLKNPRYNLDFLSTIREVTGYVLIILVYVEEIPLTNLRVIRGKNLYFDSYAVYSAVNHHADESSNTGLQRLLMPALKEIVNGSVHFEDNIMLKYLETIQWDDIQNPNSFRGNSFIDYEGECDPSCDSKRCRGPRPTQCKILEDCDPSCESESCWGPGPSNCQILTKKICSATCDYRCRGILPGDCCHRSCAAGCTDSSNMGCLACLNFTNGNECVQQCPPRLIYDSVTYGSTENPAFKLAYGSRCVDTCPDNVLENGDNCVKHCPVGMMEEGKKCINCEGACPRVCLGLEKDDILYAEHFDDGKLADCTKIDGNIIIGTSSFNGDFFAGYTPITIEMLQRFKTVKEITGFLSIQSIHHSLSNMSFFSNLEKIHGRSLYSLGGHQRYSLHITRSLAYYLPWSRLQEITAGDVYFSENHNLCYVNHSMWQRFFKDEQQEVVLIKNKPLSSCAAEGRVCHPECEPIGCWGPNPDQCALCRNAQIDRLCVPSCDYHYQGVRLYEKFNGTSSEPDICDYCNAECKSSCYGPEPDQCRPLNDPTACKNVKDGPFCRSECPKSKYPDEEGVCQFCHEHCVDGCTGPNNTVGIGGCNRCGKILLDANNEIIRCMSLSEECSASFFHDRISISENSPYAGTEVCLQCDSQCINCTGQGPAKCTQCLNVKRSGICYSQCEPLREYADENKVCRKCHGQCSSGCTGRTSFDCNKCAINVVHFENKTQCVAECPESHKFVKDRFNCLANCSSNYFPNEKLECRPCHSECLDGCTDDTRTGCHDCKNVKHINSCMEECPPGTNNSAGVCVMIKVDPSTGRPSPLYRNEGWLAIIIPVIVVVLFIMIIVFVCTIYRAKKKNIMYVDYDTNIPMHGLDDKADEPLTPSGMTPNQAFLKIIKDTELKKGPILGSGAFGTVYKGLWVPEGEPKVKIPVAIKILREVSSLASEELLEEAKVMASVDHPCLLRLLCVCMAQEMMLITQLMPLGALLDYIRKHKDKIGSHHLLKWSYQIAEGMVYLEEKHLIHRDLAARNVLVQTPSQVKITDFGLAKFLDIEESEYKAQGGKMPIKWLALESIQFRKFSHKSDVWSFGVTLWELMTFGGKPYDGVKARDVPELLDKGERLSQPPICTIDVYMLMVKCWLIDENSRPSFKQLAEELERMTKDPQRYLVIQHDSNTDALPSPTPSEFYKALLSDGMEGADPSMLMDAEEYLQPMGQIKENFTYQSNQGFPFPPTNMMNSHSPQPLSISSPKGDVINGKALSPTRKDSSLTRYCQDPTIAKQYERQRSNLSPQGPANEDYLTPDVNQDNYQPLLKEDEGFQEPQYQNDPLLQDQPRQDAYLPLADDDPPPMGVACDNLEYHALLGSAASPLPQPQPEVWTPRHTQHNGFHYPPVNGTVANNNISSSTPVLYNPLSPLNQGATRYNRLHSSPDAGHEHDYINNDIQVGGAGESTV